MSLRRGRLNGIRVSCSLAAIMCAGLAVPSVADPVTLVSSGSAGNAVGGSSALVSSSGRYVVFTSSSPDVVAGQVDTNGALDVFLLDRTTATVMLVSRSLAEPTTAGNGPSFAGALSADGRYVLFTSGASDLTATDTNGTDDIFLFDRVTATVTLVSRSTAGPITAANGTSRAGAMTANGRYVLFASDATDLTTTDTNGAQDVFLFDLTREP